MARTLRHRRLEAGLSQEGLAYAAGLSRNHIQLLEREVGALPNPTLRTLYAIAEALDCRVIDLLPPDAK